MKDFRPFWKELANNKQITTGNIIQRCILLGMHQGATFEEKVDIASERLSRSFTPKLKNPVKVYEWQGNCCVAVERPYYALEYNLKFYGKSHIGLCRQLDLSDNEMVEFDKIAAAIVEQGFDKFNVHYSYIFLFGDLIPEQRCIQMGHVMLKMGVIFGECNLFPPGVDADNLHFCMVQGTDETSKILNEMLIPCITFKDYDYSFEENGSLYQSKEMSLKAVVTYPIHWSRRGKLAECELYRFESN